MHRRCMALGTTVFILPSLRSGGCIRRALPEETGKEDEEAQTYGFRLAQALNDPVCVLQRVRRTVSCCGERGRRLSYGDGL